MNTIIKHVLLDLFRNKVVIIYTLILALLSFSVLSIDSNTSKGLLSLMNITLLFVPIISILFATIYFYNSIEFIELLLAQPLQRKSVLLSEYFGLASSLASAFLIGIGLPVFLLAPGLVALSLVISGILLTLTFCALALFIFVLIKDKTKGIGLSIIMGLFFTLLFDGFLILFIYAFGAYPIEPVIIGILALNPIDLARVMILLQLDVAVMMGYSGALFKEFLGSSTGSMFTFGIMTLWAIIPVLISVKIFKKKDL